MTNLALFISLFLVTPAIALIPRSLRAEDAVPMLINYQGELRSPATGEPVPDGSYDMVFRIYDLQFAGTPIWKGTHSTANGNPVQVNNGIFSVILGSGTGNTLEASVFREADRWLEIVVGTETLSPRQRITAAAYSLVSENSRLLGGNEPSAFIIQTQGLRLQPDETSPNIMAGYIGNGALAGAVGATVSGGGVSASTNTVTDSFGTIGGGNGNQAGDNVGSVDSAMYGTVGGGSHNTASGPCATVGGGIGNTASDWYATVAGGQYNQANASYATIAGGGTSDLNDPTTANLVTDDYGTVGGGGHNQAGDNAGTSEDAPYATVAGGSGNTASGRGATVAGGVSNTVTGLCATVGGGHNNIASRSGATVGGGGSNAASGPNATVAGGEINDASGDYATVGGGLCNQANAAYATIAGGGPSDLQDLSTTRNLVTDDYGTIGGGGHNRAGNGAGTTADARNATVAGGENNVASGIWSTVGGGGSNAASGPNATVAGGALSTASGEFSAIAGGINNQAGARGSAVGGGENNLATGAWATVAGGGTNKAVGDNAIVPGGAFNEAQRQLSFAAGYRAKAKHDGSFVWADTNLFDFSSTANNEFSARCTGGGRFVSAIDGSGNPSAGVRLAAGSGSWSSISDRALKDNVTPVDGRQVLDRLMAMPIAEWNYKAQDASIRHMGPMAQDFYEAFGLGEDDKHITTVDADGAALAAIQGLHKIVQEKESRISTLEQRNADLEERLEALEALVVKLTNGKDNHKNAE